MNVMFNIRLSIRPSFPIHPFAYLQNLLKNFEAIRATLKIFPHILKYYTS